MCGIVGLFLKDRALEPKLGQMLGQMLEVMTDRGPDSAGFAVYGAGAPGRTSTSSFPHRTLVRVPPDPAHGF